MIIARQSTARTVTVGPVLDADGVAVTDGVVGDFKISKNGGAPEALNGSATATHRHTGFYSLALTASDLDTVGQAEIVIDDTTNAMAMKEITVVEEAVYDISFAASATGAVPVASIAANAITATSIASDAITAAKIATGAIDADAIADNAIDAGAIATGAITASKFAAGAIDAAALAADAGTEIGTAVWATTTRALTILDEDSTTLDLDATIRAAVGLASANLDTQIGDLPTNAELATSQAAADDATLAAIAALNNLSAAQVNAEVDTALADIHLDHLLATTYDPASKPGAADALLNELVESDSGVARFTANALEQGPSGGSAPSAADIADAVWDEALSGHTASGSAGEALGAAGGAGDPWITSLPGSYTGSQAGKILADILVDTGTTLQGELDGIQADTEDIQSRLPATLVSGRIDASIGAAAANTITASALASDAVTEIQSGLATSSAVSTLQTSVDDLPTNAELSTALAAADDAVLSAIAALNNLSQANIRTAVGLSSANLDTQLAAIDDAVDTEIGSIVTTLSTIAGYLDAEIADIKAKTDNLPSDPADQSAVEAAIATVSSAIAALNNLSAAQVNAEVVDALAVDVVADSIPADGSRPTIAQAAYLLTQWLCERTVSGTTMTVRKPDGSTTLATFTLGDATSPTSITRAS